MGQAKIRGTFEERKAEAIERNREVMEQKEAYRRQKRKTKTSTKFNTLMAIAAGMAVSNNQIQINEGHVPWEEPLGHK